MTNPLFSFFTILLSLGFAFFYVKPEYTLVQENRANLVSLVETAESSKMIDSLIKETEKNLNSVNPMDLANFDIFLPEVVDPIRLANNLSQMGLLSEIILQDIKVIEPAKSSQENTASNATMTAANGITKTFSIENKVNQSQGLISEQANSGRGAEKKYATTKVTFSFTATYEKFHLFLNDIEKSLGLMNITALSFQPLVEVVDPKNPKKVSSPVYQFRIEMETYSLK